MVDQCVVARGKRVSGHPVAVTDAFVGPIGHQLGHGQAHVGVERVVDHLGDAVLDIRLENQTGFVFRENLENIVEDILSLNNDQEPVIEEKPKKGWRRFLGL